MHEQILMADAHVWHAGREKQIGHASEYLVEIDDQIGTAALYLVGNETHALPVFGKLSGLFFIAPLWLKSSWFEPIYDSIQTFS